MGTCMSKKSPASTTTTTTTVSSSSPPAVASIAATPLPDLPTKQQPKLEEVKRTPQREEKKEIFIIKQRKSHERRPEDKPKITLSTPVKAVEVVVSSPSSSDVVVVGNGDGGNGKNGGIIRGGGGGGAPVRTSSCTKEEVDAILIQCGRLSRSSSGKAASSENTNSRKYSGSKKRSYDFDHENERGDDVCVNEEIRRHHHHSRSSHRRTPSRERDLLDSKRSNSRERDPSESKRSNSRDRYSSSREEERTRNGGSSSRRVSRSPGRRSETNNPQSANAAAIDNKSRPGKMVSVPASASGTTGIKRVIVKRSGEMGQRTTAASPRSQSPANVRSCNENTNAHHQQPSLSRSSSRKAEHSPYRRNPMSEIDENCLTLKTQDQNNININNNKVQRVKETEQGVTKKPSHLQSQKPEGGRHNRTRSDVKEQLQQQQQQQQLMVEDNLMEEVKGLPLKSSKGMVAPTGAGVESVNPQTLTRSRSSRKSRDFDLNMGFNPDTLLNPTSYASLLLEDIQNFHQQNTTATTFTLPPCVTKACSILEAVADLNSCTGSNLSTTFSEDRSSEADRHNKNTKTNATYVNTHIGKRRLEVKDPFVESELAVNDDIMEPSLHKYITVRRGMVEGEMEQQESAGSNSFVGTGQHWVSNSSSWEPNSADSTDRWTSRSKSGEEVVMDKEEPSLLGPEKQILRCNDNNSTYLPSLAPSGRKRSGQMMTPIKAAAASM